MLVTTDELKRLSKPCKDSKAIAQVGTISANADESIGKTIADAMEEVGREGVITVEEGQGLVDAPKLDTYYRHFTGDDETFFYGMLGSFWNPLAQQRDAASRVSCVSGRAGEHA